jgi:hypothetical protein
MMACPATRRRIRSADVCHGAPLWRISPPHVDAGGFLFVIYDVRNQHNTLQIRGDSIELAQSLLNWKREAKCDV